MIFGPRVTVYSTPTCGFCTMLKRYLRQKGVHYTEKDVSKDQVSAQEMIKKSGQRGVPVIDVNGRVVVGFNKGVVNRLLGLK